MGIATGEIPQRLRALRLIPSIYIMSHKHPLSPAPEDLMPWSDFCKGQAHTRNIDIHPGKTFIHKKQINLKDFFYFLKKDGA